MDRTPLSPDEIRTALAGLPDWRPRLGGLCTAYRCASPAAALALVAQVGAAAEELDHHPEVDWRYDHVFLTTTTHSAGRSLSAYDPLLAGRVSALAASAGAQAVPELHRSIEICYDTADPSAVRDVLATALGYTAVGDSELLDPFGRGPSVWFQVSDTPAANRVHLDVSVAAEVADAIVADGAAAGAAVDTDSAPSFTVLTDVDGNRVCVCTPLGRSSPA